MAKRAPREPTCWARGALDLIDYAVAQGVPRAHFQAAGLRLPAHAWHTPEQRIPISVYYDVVEAVAEALRDPLLGIHYIAQIQPSAIDAVGFLATASRTLGEAVARIMRHHRWITEGERFELDVVAGVASFHYVPWGPARIAHAHVADMYAADCLVLAPRMTGAPVSVLSLTLAHPPLAAPQDYARHFGAVPVFDAPRNEWRIPADVLQRLLPGADPGLVQFFSRYLEERHGARLNSEHGTAAQVRQMVCEALPEGVPTLSQIAQQLHTSERSVQRQLAAAGTSLSALVDDVRRTRALACLEMHLPATEISLLLGYAEPAAFHRAFKRWTGVSTTQWTPAAPA